MIHVLHSLTVSGAETDYEVAHRKIPGDLVPAMARAGITNWSIHRTGNHLIHLVEQTT
jgi:L-rhamnose mutarotase